MQENSRLKAGLKTMTISCRFMNDHEAPAVSQVVRAAFDAGIAPLFPVDAVERMHDYVRPEGILRRNQLGHRVLVAESDGEIVGMVQFTESHIRMLFVAPHLQRQGVGRALLEAVFAIFHAANPKPAIITVNSSPNSVTAYQRFGFVQTQPEQDDNGIRFFPMQKPLIESRSQ